MTAGKKYRDPRKAREARRQYQAAHPDRVKASTKKRRLAHPEQCKEHSQRQEEKRKSQRRTVRISKPRPAPIAYSLEYAIYKGARNRCENPRNHGYRLYGAMGVRFCFRTFAEFMAALGPRPSQKHSVDRYPDPNGNYEAGNVRWATPSQQRTNQRPKKRSA